MSQPTFDSNGKRYWLPHEEQRLRELKRARRSWAEIATALKRTPKSCVEKWQYINPTVPPDVKPEPAFDEGHVAACLAEGGFTWWSERELGRDRLNRRKMAVCLPLRRVAA